MDRILKVNIYMVDQAMYAGMNEVYAKVNGLQQASLPVASKRFVDTFLLTRGVCIDDARPETTKGMYFYWWAARWCQR